MAFDRSALLDQLIRHEGLRLTLYTDTRGVPTIGVGRNLRDVGISKAEALDLLSHDVDAAITDLAQSYPWFSDLDPVRQMALVDLRFNVGRAGLRGFVRFLAAMAAENYPAAAVELRLSRWALQVTTRADDLATMIANGTETRTA